MTDVRALRSTLSNTDVSAPSIQSSASSMMRMYDKSPSLAVAEWRNVLQTCGNSQLLPLLYVANEVLQISKRNRGNKYLEAFSPVLGGSLKVICERDPSVTEKVRRTAKIWGERRIFSTRFIGEILAGLEEFRGGKKPAVQQIPKPASSGNFTPIHGEETKSVETKNNQAPNDDDPFAFEAQMDENGDPFDDDPFASSGPSQLNVSINVNKQVQASKSLGSKRSRPSEKSPTTSPRKKMSRRRSVLATSSLVELVDQLSNLENDSKSIARLLSSITSSELYASKDEVNEVGDELIELHNNVNTMIKDTKQQKKNLRRVAEGKRQTESELKRYLVWMRAGLNTDKDEIKFCEDLEQKLLLLQYVHADAKKARDAERMRIAAERETAKAAALEAAQKEEVKRSLEQIQKQSSMNESRPGMVWNKQTREYQFIDTEESWRD